MPYGLPSPYANQLIKGQMCIWLQNYGWCAAKLATEFKPGEKIIYNYGISCTIMDIQEKSPAFLEFSVLSDDGKIYHQHVKKTAYKPYQKGK